VLIVVEVKGYTSVTFECPKCGMEITVDDVEVTIDVDLSEFAPDRSWRD